MPPPIIRPARPDEHDEIALVWMNSWVSTGLAEPSNFLLAQLRARIPMEIEKGWSLFVADDSHLAAMLALHLPKLPMAKVPALKDGEATLAEAAAICAYVAGRYPEAKLAPPLGDPLRAKYLYWLFFAPSCIEPAMVQVATKIEMSSTAAGWGEAQRVFDVLDATLSKGPWILGEAFSAADIAIGSGLNFAVRLFKMVPSRPSFDRYIDRCAARPAFQRAGAIAAG
jgi:glutathione S-transferase